MMHLPLIRKWSWHLLNKSQLRKQLREKRQSISQEQQQIAMVAVADLCVRHPVFKQSQQIACYLQNDNEIDCAGIIAAIWEAKKSCYLPLLAPEGKSLEFALYQVSDFLYPNKYGILEPCDANKVSAKELDLVIVPLVGFDLQGHRLGMGGGYYDRTFEFLLGEARAKKPYLLGLAFEGQNVESLPNEEWDVCLDGVLTEKQWKPCHSE